MKARFKGKASAELTLLHANVVVPFVAGMLTALAGMIVVGVLLLQLRAMV